MITKIKNALFLLIIGFILGFFSTFLLPGLSRDSSSKKASVVQAEDLKKKADSSEKKYVAEIQNLQDENSRLQQNLALTQGQLYQMKQATKETENKIKKIMKPDKPLEQVASKIETSEKPSDGLVSCDSLKTEVQKYLDENFLKDSLYENEIELLDSTVSCKDSIIETGERLYNNLHQLFAQSLESQRSLQNENFELQKKFKRQRLRSKLSTIGLMILSGIGANYLLHH